MVITYLIDTGDIVAPIQTCDRALTLNEVFGEKAGIYSRIYDVINIVDDMNIFTNIFSYKVDLNTRKLVLKEKESPISLEV